LLILLKVNGYTVDTNTSQCNEIISYLEGRGKGFNLKDCKMNDDGEVTELYLYIYCLDDEEFNTILSYNTIESLQFEPHFEDRDFIYIEYNDEHDIIYAFGCTKFSFYPFNYKALSNLTNLKYLNLIGIKDLPNSLFDNIPKSVEKIEFGGLTLTQRMIDILSNLTNLNSLIINEVQISGTLDFSEFENLKNLTFLEITYTKHFSDFLSTNIIQGDMLKYCRFLKRLVINNGSFYNDSLDAIGYMTELEELTLNGASFREVIGDPKFSSLKNEISKESANRFECIENLKSYLENDVPKLNEMLNNEKIKREEGDDGIDKKVTEEILQVQGNINEDKKNRETTEEAILEMLRVLVTKSKADIEAEREEREKTEETLIALLEDTCSKLAQQEQ